MHDYILTWSLEKDVNWPLNRAVLIIFTAFRTFEKNYEMSKIHLLFYFFGNSSENLNKSSRNLWKEPISWSTLVQFSRKRNRHWIKYWITWREFSSWKVFFFRAWNRCIIYNFRGSSIQQKRGKKGGYLLEKAKKEVSHSLCDQLRAKNRLIIDVIIIYFKF